MSRLERSNDAYLFYQREGVLDEHRNKVEYVDPTKFKKIKIVLDDYSTKKNRRTYFNIDNTVRKKYLKNIKQFDISKPIGLWYSCGVEW